MSMPARERPLIMPSSNGFLDQLQIDEPKGMQQPLQQDCALRARGVRQRCEFRRRHALKDARFGQLLHRLPRPFRDLRFVGECIRTEGCLLFLSARHLPVPLCIVIVPPELPIFPPMPAAFGPPYASILPPLIVIVPAVEWVPPPSPPIPAWPKIHPNGRNNRRCNGQRVPGQIQRQIRR